jgi:hypothetical protein
MGSNLRTGAQAYARLGTYLTVPLRRDRARSFTAKSPAFRKNRAWDFGSILSEAFGFARSPASVLSAQRAPFPLIAQLSIFLHGF